MKEFRIADCGLRSANQLEVLADVDQSHATFGALLPSPQAPEFQSLFDAAGFELTRILPVEGSLLSVLEGVRV